MDKHLKLTAVNKEVKASINGLQINVFWGGIVTLTKPALLG